MTTRRGFMAGMLATGLAPKPSWADAGNPAYLSAAKRPDGSYHLYGLDDLGAPLFSVPLPDRGHAAAAHPTRPEAVAFARRPGTFAIVLDCISGGIRSRMEAPEGRHFYGHGVFSADGSLLFTPENDYEAGQGRIGVWQAGTDYIRIDEFSSGGVGPHDIARLPGTDTMVVANGGIETHPDAGRAKLNLPVMRPNLTYLDGMGRVTGQIELNADLHLNSIRHLAVRGDGLVAFAMQWQGDGAVHPPLLGLHRDGDDVLLLQAPDDLHRRMEGYAGSVAISSDGGSVAITSPRGGAIQLFDTDTAVFVAELPQADVCGINAGPEGFVATTGNGTVIHMERGRVLGAESHRVAWDNHLIRL
ncbi:MAG: DUF1513 domain-containing protein [Confluentimicrobium sp.]|uniref:DUF1513 domain-containing protein n=1 Tax=Actibacterium sp. TaxID=1872125 RepID=UPI0005100BEC|nr:DUF1513 domain-containing protein [Actibacterium sp.]KGB81731.1 twin-arginine translocation pathway signal [Rhodovulum sp. NI22]MBC58057.1 DUF1513 domain-containing protein [Actibacterium sp.]